jgi:hypothetical protein
MRHIAIAATAAVALASASLAAVAQQTDEEKQRQRPQMQQGQPSQPPSSKGAEEREPSAKSKKKSDDKSAADEKSETPKKGTAERKSDGPSKGTAERKEGAPDKGTAQKGDDGTKGMAGEKGDTSKGTAQRKQEPTDKGTAQRKDEPTSKGTAEQKGDVGDQKKGPAAAAKDGMEQDKRADLSDDQRTRVRTTIRELNVRPVTNVNFSINAGVRIPRTVTLHALPRTVVEIVPYYRGYRYFVAGARIVIVDPATYEIVYVIDEGGPDTRTARLVLSGPQRQLLLSHVEFDRPARDVNLRLALGAEIPAQVELLEFADPVISGIPEIRTYRYVIVDRSVAIVDPDTRDVLLVVDR